ncbi:MAG: DUF370 domain-containing protein [Clostridiales bacterium]|jgi:regulator of extracellular matrix RemA (YlzA/DUF370 family)|nr:DUF370 domain-containing protein [Clostridiales bacterium]
MIKDIVNIGNNTLVVGSEIRGVTSYDSQSRRNELQVYRSANRVTDATKGRHIRSLIFTKDGHVYLSILTTETIASRMTGTE